MEFHYYQDAAGEWRWRLVSFFGEEEKVVADSGEGYKNKADMLLEIAAIKTKSRDAITRKVEK